MTALRDALLSADVPYLKCALVDKGLLARAPGSVPNARSRRRCNLLGFPAEASQDLIVNALSQSRGGGGEREKDFPLASRARRQSARSSSSTKMTNVGLRGTGGERGERTSVAHA